MIEATIERLRVEEGFRAKPYQCSEGVWTIGYGFTYLTKRESEIILAMRVNAIHLDMLKYEWYRQLNGVRQSVICQLYFQLGKKGLFGFKKMIKALEKKDYNRASSELKDSRLYRQTPSRTRRLSHKLSLGF